MPVKTQPLYGVLSIILTFTLLLFLTSRLQSQTLIGGSLYSEDRSHSQSSNKLWLQYQNSFEFKKGLFIDSDFGHIFHTDVRDKRLQVRSVFKYQITENLKVGGGMGLFWYYDRPNLTQELRFIQEINYFKDFGSSIMFHDLRLEQQIQQAINAGDDYHTRIRYRVGLQFPTNGPVYFGMYDEVFKNFSKGAQDPFFSMNRAAVFVGLRTYQFVNLEAHLMMEDIYGGPELTSTQRTFIFQLVARHTI